MLESSPAHLEESEFLIEKVKEETQKQSNNLKSHIKSSQRNIEEKKPSYLDIVVSKINKLCKQHLEYGKPYFCDTLVKKVFEDNNLNGLYGTYKMYDFLKKSEGTNLIKESGVVLFDDSKQIPVKGSILCFVNKNNQQCGHVGIYGGLDKYGKHTIYDASTNAGVDKRQIFPDEFKANKIKYFTYIPK